MRQTSKRFYSMILALTFLVAALVVFFDLIQPTYAGLQEKKGRQLSAEQLYENEKRVVEQAKNLLSQYQAESQTEGNLALAMPTGPSVAGALAQLYGIATNNSLTLRTITITPPSISFQNQGAKGGGPSANQILKPIATLTFQLSGEGSYESLKSFLSQLETNLRVFDVTGLSVQPSVVTGAKAAAPLDLFAYNLTVATYYQLP